jgi:LPXTG-motif cell wall-anchored protein
MVAGAVILVGAFPADAGTTGGHPYPSSSTQEDTTSTEKETTSTSVEETTSTTEEETTTTTAPEETTTTVAGEVTTTVTPTTAPTGELPKTGSNTGLMVALGAALLAGGGALLATTRVLRRS